MFVKVRDVECADEELPVPDQVLQCVCKGRCVKCGYVQLVQVRVPLQCLPPPTLLSPRSPKRH